MFLSVCSDCRAALEDYNKTGNPCRIDYESCISLGPINGGLGCNLTNMCSNECRLLYQRLENCNSTFPPLMILQSKVDLLCSLSNINNNTPCGLLFSEAEYEISACFLIQINPDAACDSLCYVRVHSLSKLGDCCIINKALYNDDFNIANRIWSTCNVTSPGKCPSLPPARIVTPPEDPTSPPEDPSSPTDLDGGASCPSINSSVFQLSILIGLLCLYFSAFY